MAKTEVRERIAEAAWRLFDEKGYENVSVDEIIAATGTSKGAFYHYFSAKDELLSALPDKFDNDYDAWAAQCPPGMPSADRIVALCRFVCKNMELKLSRQIITEIYSTQLVTRGPKFLTSESRRYVKLLNQYVHEGQERGEITRRDRLHRAFPDARHPAARAHLRLVPAGRRLQHGGDVRQAHRRLMRAMRPGE